MQPSNAASATDSDISAAVNPSDNGSVAIQVTSGASNPGIADAIVAHAIAAEYQAATQFIIPPPHENELRFMITILIQRRHSPAAAMPLPVNLIRFLVNLIRTPRQSRDLRVLLNFFGFLIQLIIRAPPQSSGLLIRPLIVQMPAPASSWLMSRPAEPPTLEAFFFLQDLLALFLRAREEHQITEITEIGEHQITEITEIGYRRALEEQIEGSQDPIRNPPDHDHVIVTIRVPIYYGPESRPVLHGPQNLGRLERGMRTICESIITWMLLLLIGVACAASAPFLITDGKGPPLLCIGAGLSFFGLYCIGLWMRPHIITWMRVPWWVSIGLSAIFGGTSVAWGSHLPSSERAISGFGLLAVAFFCLLQGAQPPSDFGGLMVFVLFPLQVAVLHFHGRFTLWYPGCIVFLLVLLLVHGYVTRLMDRRYR